LILSVIAIGLNLYRLDIFFGFELLLGSSLGVLALLLLGDIGLVVGISASVITWKVWGYPWCALTVIIELLWLRSYLRFFGDTASNADSGRIILADVLYWIIVGIPMALLVFGLATTLDPGSMLMLVIKQSINGVINTTIGFSLFLGFRILRTWSDRSKAISIRGLITALIMISMITPSLIILAMVSGQMVQAIELGEMEDLQMIAYEVATTPDTELQKLADSLYDSGTLIEFERIKANAIPQRFQSSPGLFKTISEKHRPNNDSNFKIRGMQLLSTTQSSPYLKRLINSYLKLNLDSSGSARDVYLGKLDDGHVNVIAIKPARELIQKLQLQSSRIIGILAWSLLFAVLISEILAQELSKQFSLSYFRGLVEAETESNSDRTGLHQTNARSLKPFRTGFILDLNQIIMLLNQRSDLINSLHDDLQNTRIRLKTSRQEFDTLNITDPLTGCFNRHELYRRLDFELQRSNRNRSELSFVCFEVDHYNEIRDSYGQSMVEKVLIELVVDIKARSRTTDCLCRSGESEFSLVLPMCSVKSAESFAQKLLEAVKSRVITLDDRQMSVTISVGISCLRTGNDDSESLINRAESALYRAKLEGRNRIVIS